jgi:predicted ATPase
VHAAELRADHPLTAWLADLRRTDRVVEVELGSFDETDTALLAAHLAGWPPAAGWAAEIYRATDGNPLFVVEMVRAGMGADELHNITDGLAGHRVLPPKIQATIQYRLSQLSANAQALTQIAAVIGREFTLDVLALVSAQTEDTLLRSLDELWHQQIVREQGVNAYDFSHSLIRVVAYAAMSATTAVLHP